MATVATTLRDVAGNAVALPARLNSNLLFGHGLATWMEFYTYDGVNLVLQGIASTLGLSQGKSDLKLAS
jgi:hypothetical protein